MGAIDHGTCTLTHDYKYDQGRLPGCSHFPDPQNENVKNTDFLNVMKPKVLRDLPFTRNHPPKWADD
jgi:hypothetical protein